MHPSLTLVVLITTFLLTSLAHPLYIYPTSFKALVLRGDLRPSPPTGYSPSSKTCLPHSPLGDLCSPARTSHHPPYPSGTSTPSTNTTNSTWTNSTTATNTTNANSSATNTTSASGAAGTGTGRGNAGVVNVVTGSTSLDGGEGGSNPGHTSTWVQEQGEGFPVKPYPDAKRGKRRWKG
ncbi:MAG: hypothetical protein M1836_000834 [Candelina mexicana]|nr:MAG: hypothetical protein M1836_000834 [Candelina mexicana]